MKENIKILIDAAYKEVERLSEDFHYRLDCECARVLLESGIEGPLTAEKVSAAGYVIVHTPDGAARVCKDGKPVSKVIYRAKFYYP